MDKFWFETELGIRRHFAEERDMALEHFTERMERIQRDEMDMLEAVHRKGAQGPKGPSSVPPFFSGENR